MCGKLYWRKAIWLYYCAKGGRKLGWVKCYLDIINNALVVIPSLHNQEF